MVKIHNLSTTVMTYWNYINIFESALSMYNPCSIKWVQSFQYNMDVTDRQMDRHIQVYYACA